MSNPYAHADVAYDEMDPHGFQGESHGDHVVVDWRILVGVLGALLFFTLLTTTMATVEQWVANEWMITIPHWINVVGALSIAVIKATLVCMFFMQLRYDKPLNTMILLFCLLALGLFLGLTALDLGARDRIYGFKHGTIHPGGNAMSAALGGTQADIGPRPDTMGMSMVEYARAKYIQKYGEEKWKEEMANELAHAHGGHARPEVELPNPNRSFTRVGVTPHLYDLNDPVAVHAMEELRSGGHAAPESSNEEPSGGGH